MKTLYQWLNGGYRWFNPWFCIDCKKFTLVFKDDNGDKGRCESCWLELK